MDDRVKEQFSARARVYNANRRLLIADFDEYYSIAADAPSFVGSAPRVLDLGAGTGLSSEFLLRRYPEARITLVDFSEAMLDEARERFCGRANIDYLVGDYRSLPETGEFDLVISGLSIHHLSHAEKRALFTRVFALLKAGGEFVNADLVLGGDARLEQLMQERLRGFLREGLDDDGMKRFVENQRIDDPASLTDQLSWLKKAGFSLVDCLYRRWVYAVFYARV